MGAERFFNIKCRVSGLVPDAAVVVSTVRALKAHSGRHAVVAGRPLPPALLAENPDEVHIGGANLRKQLENVRLHGVTPVKIEAIAGRVYGADGVDYSAAASRQLDSYERERQRGRPVVTA
jgi:formyltetrahydrofolate synthetase